MCLHHPCLTRPFLICLQFYHLIPAHGLRSLYAAQPSAWFEELLVGVDAGGVDASQPCARSAQPAETLLRSPEMFTLAVVWESPQVCLCVWIGGMHGLKSGVVCWMHTCVRAHMLVKARACAHRCRHITIHAHTKLNGTFQRDSALRPPRMRSEALSRRLAKSWTCRGSSACTASSSRRRDTACALWCATLGTTTRSSRVMTRRSSGFFWTMSRWSWWAAGQTWLARWCLSAFSRRCCFTSRQSERDGHCFMPACGRR